MKPDRIVLVHGIYAREGNSNVWNMKEPLERATGLPVEVFEYGFVSAWQARFTNGKNAKKLAKFLRATDVVVNHSNGAAVTWLATNKYGARPFGVVMLQPALDTWLLPKCDWVHVYYNAEDHIVWWSGLLLFHIWGRMGQVGYKPRHTHKELPGVRQIDTINAAAYLDLPPARGHLAVFQQPDVQSWGQYVGHQILLERE